MTQSNHDFSVGGTLSVNAHGWPVPYGPFGATVRAFRMMLADGTVVTCSRTENAELFALAIGGYGLFGIVIDAELEMADNVLLAARHEVMPAAQFAARFIAVAREAGVRMAYGRLSVARENYLGEAALVSYRPAANQPVAVAAAARRGRVPLSVAKGVSRADRLGERQEAALVSRNGARAAPRRAQGGDAQRDPECSGRAARRQRSAPHRHPA